MARNAPRHPAGDARTARERQERRMGCSRQGEIAARDGSAKPRARQSAKGGLAPCQRVRFLVRPHILSARPLSPLQMPPAGAAEPRDAKRGSSAAYTHRLLGAAAERDAAPTSGPRMHA